MVRLARAIDGVLETGIQPAGQRAGAHRGGDSAALALPQLRPDAELAVGLLRDQLEAEGGDGVVRRRRRRRVLVPREVHGLEGGVQLAAPRHRRARDRVVVHVDVLERPAAAVERPRRQPVAVQRQPRPLQRRVLLVPLVPQHPRLALAHGSLVRDAQLGCVLRRCRHHG